MSVTHHSNITIHGINSIFKKIDNVVKWSEKDSLKLQEIGHRVGNVYANWLKTNIKDLGKDITVRTSTGPLRGKSGQLRRSAGTWLPDKNRNVVMGGPRTNSIGKRKTKKYSDGWYAHIVEKGDFSPRFGGKHVTQNTGVFKRGLLSTRNRSINLQIRLYKQQFKRYIKTA